MGNPAIDAVKALNETETGSGETTLSTGVRVRLRPVPAWLIQDAQARVKNPSVPNWHNPDKDRDEPNPADPDYLLAVQEANVRRAEVVIDIIALMGMELVDGIPEDDAWLTKLRYLEKRKYISLAEYDLSDPFDREMVYKKFCALGSDDYFSLGKLAGLTGEDVAQSVANFRRDQERRADNGSSAQE